MQLVSDLNGDGTTDDKDMGLESAALNSTASPEDDAKKDGTEYLFPDDTISHGIWSKTDSNAPSGTTDDDNAKELKITCGANFGSVWFDYPSIPGGATLAFYKTRACLTADKITFPLALSAANPMPTKLYVRVEGTATSETVGNLDMKLGKADKSQTFCKVSMPLDIVTQFGDAHFFQAANRYILQNNCLHYFGVKTYGSVPIDIVVRSEDYSTMQAVDAYWNSATGAVRSPPLYGIQRVQPAYPNVDQIINGNFCGTRVGTLFYDAIDTTCLGNLITGGALDTNVSTSSTAPGAYLEGTDARYLAMSSSHQFTFGTGIVPTTSGYQEAMGGLGPTGSSDPHYFPTPYNMNMIGEAPVDSKHKVLFTLSYQATSRSGGTVSASMVSDATSSGCPPMPGGGSGEPTLVWTDGSSSIALALKSPPDTSAAGTSGVAGIPTYGTKHTLPTPLDGYYIATYLIFDSTKPRP
jgi:hypothetical protein